MYDIKGFSMKEHPLIRSTLTLEGFPEGSLPEKGKKPRTYFIQTFGCAMNERDSQILAHQLEEMGYAPVPSPEQADLVLINTCSVREKAEHKLYSSLGKFKTWKAQGSGRILVVSGCVAQQERERIRERAPHVDLVLGTHQVRAFRQHLLRVQESGKPFVATAWRNLDEVSRLDEVDPQRGKGAVAYVTIQEGCDKMCSFCIVPFTRGREVSRAPEIILAEVRRHVEAGAKEIVLLGQNVNAYGKKHPGYPSFAELLERVHEIEGVQRIRFTSPHPSDYDEDLLEAYARLPRLCPSAHLPLQAGSNRILRAMGRGYDQEEYLGLVKKLKEKRPEIHLSTDIIVGFPGEERSDFEETLKIVKMVRFAQVYSFLYSPRPFTRARLLPDPVPRSEKEQWLRELQELQLRIQYEDHQRSIGEELEVLWSEWQEGILKGRSPQGRVVHAPGSPSEVGEMERVRITRATATALYGEVVLPSCAIH